jgi:uncharacterized protein (TIGR00106 family)
MKIFLLLCTSMPTCQFVLPVLSSFQNTDRRDQQQGKYGAGQNAWSACSSWLSGSSLFMEQCSVAFKKARTEKGETMLLCELTMFPTDKGVSVSPYVARILAIIDASGLAYQLTPMATILEGSWEEVHAVATACFKELERDCERINVAMKIDYRSGTESRIHSKVERLETLLGKTLSKG